MHTYTFTLTHTCVPRCVYVYLQQQHLACGYRIHKHVSKDLYEFYAGSPHAQSTLKVSHINCELWLLQRVHVPLRWGIHIWKKNFKCCNKHPKLLRNTIRQMYFCWAKCFNINVNKWCWRKIHTRLDQGGVNSGKTIQVFVLFLTIKPHQNSL